MTKENSPHVLLASSLVISCTGNTKLDLHSFSLHVKRVLSMRGVPVHVGRSYRVSYGTTHVVFCVEEAVSPIADEGGQGAAGYVVSCHTKVESASCGQKTGPRVVGLERELTPLFSLIGRVMQRPLPQLTPSQLTLSQPTPSPSRPTPSQITPSQLTPSQFTPSSSQLTPSQFTPSPSQLTTSQLTPSPSQRTPSPSQRTPSPSQRTPSPSQRTSSPSQRTPSQPAQSQEDPAECCEQDHPSVAAVTEALSGLALAESHAHTKEDSLERAPEHYFDPEPLCVHLGVEVPLGGGVGRGEAAEEGEEMQQLTGRCVLVLAPEGCGKTQLLRHLHHTFCSVLYGKTSRSLAKLFEIATIRKPCLVLIDDVDQVPGARRLPSAVLSSPAEIVVVCTAREESAVAAEVRQLCTARLTLTMPSPHTRRCIVAAMMHDVDLCCSPDTLAAMVESTRGCTGQHLNDLVLDLWAECGDTRVVRRQDMIDALHKLKQSLQLDAAQESSAIVSQPKVYAKRSMKVCGYADQFSRLGDYARLTLQHSSIYEKLEMSPPSRILLFGPPGCGKTWLVKALAEKYSLTVRTVTRADVFSKYFGESEQKLDEIFNKALASAPCLLHFPGFDGLASARAREHHHVEGRVVNLLKSRLDGTIRLKGIVLVAETSRPELLDSAIIRRGRFLAYEYVGLPDEASREELIRDRCPELSASAVTTVTTLTEGFTMSEVVHACREVSCSGEEADLEESLGLIAPSTTKASLRSFRFLQTLPPVSPGLAAPLPCSLAVTATRPPCGWTIGLVELPGCTSSVTLRPTHRGLGPHPSVE